MLYYCKVINNGYVEGIASSENPLANAISESDANRINNMFLEKPLAPSNHEYKLRADNLEWELVELPPVEPEPLTDEEALTRYANSLTGASDQTLVEAAETLITEKIKEE